MYKEIDYIEKERELISERDLLIRKMTFNHNMITEGLRFIRSCDKKEDCKSMSKLVDMRMKSNVKYRERHLEVLSQLEQIDNAKFLLNCALTAITFFQR